MDKKAAPLLANSLTKMYSRLKTEEERAIIKEVLGLQMSKKGLKSEFLDRRIDGMKELNELIKAACPLAQNADVDKLKFLIDWMQENGVFEIIWVPKNTHIQLV